MFIIFIVLVKTVYYGGVQLLLELHVAVGFAWYYCTLHVLWLDEVLLGFLLGYPRCRAKLLSKNLGSLGERFIFSSCHSAKIYHQAFLRKKFREKQG